MSAFTFSFFFHHLPEDKLELTRCNVCNTENMDFSIRCGTCGSLLQQRQRTLDFFSTISNLWRYPDFAFRKIILAEHRNYTILIALLEAAGLSFLFLFVIKAGDVLSIDLKQLLSTGIGLAVVVFFPFLYLFSLLCYFSARVSRTGASLRGFTASMIYALHPIAISAVIILPCEIAVFGPYVFSNNPSPQTINPIPFYLLGFLNLVLAVAASVFAGKLTKLLFGTKKKTTIFAGIFFILLVVAMEIAKQIIIK